jgi:putative tricarboxylic transport membrane protein
VDILGSLALGFSVALTPFNLMLALIGCFIGTVIGALPGIGPVNGVAILIPVAFALGLPASSTLILLSSVYYGCMYGGRISSILLNIPGDEPAMMTTLDGYPMAQQGQAATALALSAVASFVGATLATIGLTLFAPLLSLAAIHFGPAEYFALFALAFAMLSGISTRNPVKALIAALIGLALATIGLDPATGIPRFTFGLYEFYEGVNFIVALVGLFAVSEFLLFLEGLTPMHVAGGALGRMRISMKDMLFSLGAMLRGSLIGFLAGVLPGAGASLGSFVAYTVERRISNQNDTFGKGDPRGVAAPEAGNNAAAGGALVPMLTLGVPGSGTTAVMLALLISLNITPGPLLFQQHPDVVWGLIAALYVANLMLLVLNLPLVGIFARMLTVPSWILMPGVMMVAYVGIYSIHHSIFDLLLITGFGLLGYLLRKLDIPLVPMVLGLLLGGIMETNLRRALSISNGDWSILISSPLTWILWALVVAMLGVSAFFEVRHVRRQRERAEGAESSGAPVSGGGS